MQRYRNYIGGEFRESESGGRIPVIEPATGQEFSTIPDSTPEDVASAVSAASEQKEWSSIGGEARSRVLNRIAEGIEARLEELALLESCDNGKPVHVARSVDIPRSARNFRFFASAAVQFGSDAYANGDTVNYSINHPLGVVGCISPWNLPLYLFTWKIAPALAAGNSVVAKPSEITPATASVLAEICSEAGLPAGCLNIVHGYGHTVGDAITGHPDVKAISFTGSTATGRLIAAKAAAAFKKVSLEMGGKNPVLIFDDCDFDRMIETTIRSSFSNQGEICLCGSRIYIQRPIYEKFKTEFVKRTRRLTVGDPRDDTSDLGAIVSADHLDKVQRYVELAKTEGGAVLTGGSRILPEGRCSGGWFFGPTIIEGLPNDCRTNQEEIFGPVVTIAPFDTESEALAMANESAYGLASVIWTNDVSRAHRLASRINSGIVWINCWMVRDLRTPFGGVRESGLGREGGYHAMRFFTEPKNVCLKIYDDE
ncbi:MAG: aldehyde dehydrogenase [Rhodothermales bacterium]|nr:aldehyde dehydrogenase [Rhodothermales bacterium]